MTAWEISTKQEVVPAEPVTWEVLKGMLPLGMSAEDKHRRKALWKEFNITGTKHLALFEVDASIKKVLKCEELFDAKPAILKAYTYAREVNPSGPDEKLEFCEFRLLLVYLKGLFEIYQMFMQLDVNHNQVLSFAELEAAIPVLRAKGVLVKDATLLWNELKGKRDDVDFHEFADWAIRHDLGGQDLLEHAEHEDKENAVDVRTALKGWSKCKEGLISVDDMKALMLTLNNTWTEDEVTLMGKVLAQARTQDSLHHDYVGPGKIEVDSFIDSLVRAREGHRSSSKK
mmetsp:Transcript_17735/g.41262  ORF Transcript_17735/g.41262 Transcript_17735/m.41262 type:complete len:286 (-) Transcript_17735:120-977(-)